MGKLLTSIFCLIVTSLSIANAPARPKAWIGISFLDVPTNKLPAQFNHKSEAGAVQIQKVFKGASGDQAGLETGDYILGIDGVPLNGRGTLIESVSNKPIGKIVTLKIGRGTKTFEQKMALSPRPEDLSSFTKLLIGSTAPELMGKYYSNDIGTLNKNRGKAILLDFWATWCGPCKMVAPILEELYIKYKSKGLVIIGISSEQRSLLESYQAKHPHSYPLFNDISQLTMGKYSAYSYPTLVYIDKYGSIQWIEPGAMPKSHIEKRIQELLKM